MECALKQNRTVRRKRQRMLLTNKTKNNCATKLKHFLNRLSLEEREQHTSCNCSKCAKQVVRVEGNLCKI